MNLSTKIKKDQSGQGLIEYIIIVSIVAIGSIATTRYLGKHINHKIAQITDVMQGKDARKNSTEDIGREHLVRKDLGSFFKGANSGKDSKDQK
ncbi:MAG: hypothetical protein VX642_06080 [Bdellovibrionota bacterium]|nr:hypothetical protein [Bdellovibrionota bacterium]